MLHDAAAVRERCGMVYRWVANSRSPHFTLDESRLTAVASYVADVTRDAYPDLKIPYHSRWRHFSAGGVDRWGELRRGGDTDALERARIAVDLATVSVLLDAGAGSAWRYHDHKTGLASHVRRDCGCQPGYVRRGPLLLRRGPSLARRSCRACAHRCRGAGAPFQVDSDDPLVGLEQRSALLRRLGAAMAERPDLYGHTPARPGNLIDYLLTIADLPPHFSIVRACDIAGEPVVDLAIPGSRSMDLPSAMPAGIPPCARKTRTDRIVPFHKLSQWLTYSLLEPLEAAGLGVERLDGLTALPEYRNGGLLVDLGVIRAARGDRSNGAPRGFLGACASNGAP